MSIVRAPLRLGTRARFRQGLAHRGKLDPERVAARDSLGRVPLGEHASCHLVGELLLDPGVVQEG